MQELVIEAGGAGLHHWRDLWRFRELLNEGRHRIEAIASLHFRQPLYPPGDNAPSVLLDIKGGLSESPYWISKRPGVIAPVIRWDVDQGVECLKEEAHVSVSS